MRLTHLRIANLRNIVQLDLSLAEGFTVFVGPNGAGKTSILEAAYLLSHAQSFRSGPNEVLIRSGTNEMVVHGRVTNAMGQVQLGLARQPGAWAARVNNASAGNLAALLAESALVCLEPGSHALISGASALRRRFLDWGVFHVEPAHFSRTRMFQRVLRQRNALLKRGVTARELDAWDESFVCAAEPVATSREKYFSRFSRLLVAVLREFLPELGTPTTTVTRGWQSDTSLQAVLEHARTNDIARRHTTRGPHRADWAIRFENAPVREQLSRGQEKLCALACVLAQAQLYAEEHGEWPIVALDDLGSELDLAHQHTVISLLAQAGAQVLITGTELPAPLRSDGLAKEVFHVEHGDVRRLL